MCPTPHDGIRRGGARRHPRLRHVHEHLTRKCAQTGLTLAPHGVAAVHLLDQRRALKAARVSPSVRPTARTARLDG